MLMRNPTGERGGKPFGGIHKRNVIICSTSLQDEDRKICQRAEFVRGFRGYVSGFIMLS
jgi:hypothetical protein